MGLTVLYTHTHWYKIIYRAIYYSNLICYIITISVVYTVCSFTSRWIHLNTTLHLPEIQEPAPHVQPRGHCHWLVSVPCLYNRFLLWKFAFSQPLYMKAFDSRLGIWTGQKISFFCKCFQMFSVLPSDIIMLWFKDTSLHLGTKICGKRAQQIETSSQYHVVT